MPDQPFVSVVTPVYNGGRYLRECIDSVLSQSRGDFEHVILDNASTDDTREIVEAYARRDRRIRMFRNDATLPPIDNWNRAVALMSDDSVYCRILHADDTLYPDCLEAMTGIAESAPGIGIVGSLRLRGTTIECGGLPEARQVFAGSDVARMFLRQEVFALAPTSGLVRSDLVRARRPFYPPHLLHADIAAYLDILDSVDFAFVHRPLCFSRVHAESITTTIAERRQTLMREWLHLLQAYGPRYFARDELAALERGHLARCHRLLVRGFVTGRGRSFLGYHLEGLRDGGRTPTPIDYAIAIAAELGASIRHPGKFARNLHRHLLP